LDRIREFEMVLAQMPGTIAGDGPVRHFFGDGLYIREYTGSKGTLAVSKLHKTNHPYFVMTGDCSVITNEGPIRIRAPHFGITKAGTKRILYFHEDTIWITVHATEETDLEKIEDQVIAKTYHELPDDVKLTLGIETEAQLCHGK